MNGLQVSRDEAMQIWLEDESIEINPEQQALDNKAKKVRIGGIVAAQSQKVVDRKMNETTDKKRTTKPQPDKEHIIKMLQALFEGHEKADNVVIENPTKIITFTYNGAPYKIDLTATRVKKS